MALGHLLADDFEGEQPAVPEAIHRLCFTPGPLTELLVEMTTNVTMLVKFILEVC